MNKKEVIEKIKNLNARETFMSEIIWVKRDDVLDIINQLDELETAKEVFNEYVEIVGNIYENPELLEEE